MKLTKENILEIVELSKTLNNKEMAKHLNVHIQSIVYWKRRLKEEGYKIETVGRRGINLKKDATTNL